MTDVCANLPDKKLTTSEENALALKATPTAHTKLVMFTMREAVKYAKRCCRDTIPDDQILSICYEALMISARSFKPNWARFFAFSKPGLRGALKEHFNKQKTVKKSVVISREELRTIATGSAEGGDPHNENACLDVEVLTGEIAEPDFKSIELREQWQLVAPLIEKLSSREQMILSLSFKSGWTLMQISKKLGVTCEAIRHIKSRALRKIRNQLLEQHRLLPDS